MRRLVKILLPLLLIATQKQNLKASGTNEISSVYYDSRKAETMQLLGYWKFSCEDALPSVWDWNSLTSTIKVPGTWRGLDCPQGKLPGTGRHRYFLQIEGEERPFGLALSLPVAGTSMTVYWNGVKIHQAGDIVEGKPGYKPAVVPVVFRDINFLIIDVANYNDRYGGLWHAPEIGSFDNLRKRHLYRFAWDGVVASLLLFSALYHTGIFWGVRKKAYLYLGIYSLAISLRVLSEGERILHVLLGESYWHMLIKFAHLGIYLGSISFYLYLKNFFSVQKWRWWELVPLTGLVLYDVMVLFTPPVFFTEFLNFALLCLLWLLLNIFYFTIHAVLQKKNGAIMILSGMLLILLATINDIFLHFTFWGFIDLAPMSLVVFSFLNAVGLETIEMRLRRTLNNLQKQIENRNENLSKLTSPLIRQFKQIQSSETAMFQAREKIPLQFAAMFADLRSFTTIAEEMGPEKTFMLLNKYLETVVPCIINNKGQILEYQGDGILAYFTSGCNDALRAALDMQQTLNQAIASGQLPQLKIGIALHYGRGDLTLLGNYKRLEPAIISPAILEVQDLENLCSHHQVSYVFTEIFYNQLDENYKKQAEKLTEFNGNVYYTIKK